MSSQRNSIDQFHELSYYTLSHQGKEFIHQHAVDAFTAQHATENTKPIALYFALAGLYLYLEKNYTGKQVQNAHVQMSNQTKKFPAFNLPSFRGDITVEDVMACAPGNDRNTQIRKWCESVWDAYRNEREKVISFTEAILT